MMIKAIKLRLLLNLLKVKHLEPKRNSNEWTQPVPLKNPESLFFEILTGQIQNPSVELQQQFSEVFSSEQSKQYMNRKGLCRLKNTVMIFIQFLRIRTPCFLSVFMDVKELLENI